MFARFTSLLACITLSVGSLAATPVVAKDFVFVAVGSSDNPAYAGETVTFTISVVRASGSGPTPTGTVSLLASVTPVAGCEGLLLNAGIASCTSASLGTGQHLLYGSYSGDAAYEAGQSESYFQQVNASANPATVSLSASVNPSTFGQAVVFTASVSGGAGAPIGTIDFRDGNTAIFGCSAVPLSSGSASCTTAGLAPGTHSIKARYAGDSTYTGSASSLHTQTVTSAPNAPTRAWIGRDTSSPVKVLAESTAATPSAMDGAGNLYAIVTTTGSEPCAMTLKYSSVDGAVAWHRDVCGPAAAAGSVALHPAGDVLIAASIAGDLYVARYEAATGAPTWERRIPTLMGGSGNNLGIAIGVDAAGNPRVAARAGTAITVYAFNAGNGLSQWQQAIAPGLSAQLSAFAVDAAGGVAVGDRRTLDAGGNLADVVTRIDAAGAILWEAATGGVIDAVAIDGDGNVISSGVTGTDKRAGTTGAVSWHNPFRGSIATDAARNIYLAGGTGDIALMKLSSAGAVLWRSAFIDPATTGAAYSVSIDGAGDLAITGEASNAQGTTLFTLKLAPADGHMIWVATEKDPVLRQRPVQVHAGANGVIVFGRVLPQSGGENQGVFRVKYAAGPDVPTPFAVATDFNDDGRSDILWRHEGSGRVYRMFMNGFTIAGQGFAYTEPDTAWRIVADADFNGDDIADLLWRNTATGQVYLMPMASSGTPAGGALVYTEPNSAWKIVQTPDLDGDGKADILWWNSTTGQVYAHLMNGTSITAQGFVYREPDTSWKIVASGDFAGSGKHNQLVWQNSATGQVYLMTVSVAAGAFGASGTMLFAEPNTAWKILAAADFNADGKSDLLWRNDTTGQVYGMLMNGASISSQGSIVAEPNLQWKVVAQGDYNGDGRADLLWRNESTGQVYMMLMNGLAIASQAMVYVEPDTGWKVLGPQQYRVP